MRKRILFLRQMCFLFLVAGLSAGCSQDTPNKKISKVDGSNYLLKSEPKDAKDVIKVRKDAQDGDDVVIVGRIGGSEDPWIKGRAAYTIVDVSLKSCKECGHDCPKPWDY